MHEIKDRHHEIIRFFLKLLGLWPYEQSYFARIQKVLFISVFLSFITAQLLALFTMQLNTNHLIKILSFVFPLLFATVKYCTFTFQADKIKQLFEQIRIDWTFLKDKLEIHIVNRYSDYARLITLLFVVLCHFGIFCYVTLQVLPLIFDVILPLNESRSCKVITITEYFINRDKYICAILLHEIISFYIAFISTCIIIMTIVIYILHACALFTVASYRMENAIEKSILAISDPTRQYLLTQRIVHAVCMHRRAIRYIQLWTSSFTKLFAILILIGITSLSLNLFQLLQLITVKNDFNEICLISVSVIFHFCYMFIINYGGEKVQVHGIHVFDASYNGLWYIAPLRIQKLLLFVMQRTIVRVNLTFGNIYIASLEGFLTLVNAAISYFTVIYSVRQ